MCQLAKYCVTTSLPRVQSDVGMEVNTSSRSEVAAPLDSVRLVPADANEYYGSVSSKVSFEQDRGRFAYSFAIFGEAAGPRFFEVVHDSRYHVSVEFA